MRRLTVLFLLLILTGASVHAQKLKTRMDSINYSLGVNMGTQLMSQNAEGFNSKMIAKGLDDAFSGADLIIDTKQAEIIIRSYFQEIYEKQLQKNLAEGQAFLEKNKEKEGVVELPSGLQYKIIKEGEGEKPDENDKVTVHYKGTLIDGTQFDSSYERGQPATFPVNGVIKGWTEALQLMKKGAKWKLYIPTRLAYGKNPRPGGKIKPNMALIFEVELIEIEKIEEETEDK